MSTNQLTFNQRLAIILLRLLLGWHFLYEGTLKLFNPSWTAKGYLMSSQGPFEGFFLWLASDSMIEVVDVLNIYGLFVIGLALFIGIFERPAALGGMLLLVFYYLSHPPFWGLDQVGVEGNYWIVNKNLIEAAALLALFYFPTSHYFGLRYFLNQNQLQNG